MSIFSAASFNILLVVILKYNSTVVRKWYAFKRNCISEFSFFSQGNKIQYNTLLWCWTAAAAASCSSSQQYNHKSKHLIFYSVLLPTFLDNKNLIMSAKLPSVSSASWEKKKRRTVTLKTQDNCLTQRWQASNGHQRWIRNFTVDNLNHLKE